MYGDLRDQMHPRVAAAVPSTPEATAILENGYIKPLTFGGLVTKLVETGAVDASEGMGSVRTDVSAMLGIDEAEFSARLAQTRLIYSSEAESWIHNFRIKSETELRDTKRQEALSHFTESIFSQVEDPHPEILEPIVEEQGQKVVTIEQEIAELEAKGLVIRVFPLQAQLDQVIRPKLESLQAARYAIPLADLTTLLQTDPLIMEHGQEFAQEVIKSFGDSLQTAKLLPKAWWLSEQFGNGETYMSEDDVSAFQSIWLTERELIPLAKAYSGAFYGYLSDIAPGTEEVESLPNPLADVLSVTDEERQAFFIAFPLADDSRSQ